MGIFDPEVTAAVLAPELEVLTGRRRRRARVVGPEIGLTKRERISVDREAEQKTPYGVEELRWLYEELIRVERHWTEQVQNQQDRISTLLTVTGILLGFLAGAGFLARLLDAPVRQWPVYVYILSLVSLCCALFMGIRALRPGIEIAGVPDWLNQEQILGDAASLSQQDLLRKLCASAAANQKVANHPGRLRERRLLMLRQFTFLMLALALLVSALAGVLLSKPAAKAEAPACPHVSIRTADKDPLRLPHRTLSRSDTA